MERDEPCCIIDNCQSSVGSSSSVARTGYCKLHYQNWKIYGDPLKTEFSSRDCIKCGKEISIGHLKNNPNSQYCKTECYNRRDIKKQEKEEEEEEEVFSTPIGETKTEQRIELTGWALITLANEQIRLIEDCLEANPDFCVYCGDYATHRDHLLPRSISGEDLRSFVPTVPSCSDCNVRLGEFNSPVIWDRCAQIAQRLRRKYRTLLQQRPWTNEELEKLGDGLRVSVSQYEKFRRFIFSRLNVLDAGGLSAVRGGNPLEGFEREIWGKTI